MHRPCGTPARDRAVRADIPLPSDWVGKVGANCDAMLIIHPNSASGYHLWLIPPECIHQPPLRGVLSVFTPSDCPRASTYTGVTPAYSQH